MWPDLFDLVERRVKPERMKVKRKALRDRWWQFAEKQPALREAIQGLDRVLVIAQTSRTLAFVFKETDTVFSHKCIVVALNSYPSFAVLQSWCHLEWARFFGSTMKDDPVYTPSDCFETFPFPIGFEGNEKLEGVGHEYYQYRADLMVRNNEGLTETYNRFNGPSEVSPDVMRLRQLHDAIDRAVLDAYGWNDIETLCGFGLDYLDVEDEDLPNDIPEELWWPTAASAAAFEGKLPSTRRRRPWRYRWPEEIHDEVLARLLALNAERAEEERRTGASAQGKKKRIKSGRRKKKTASDEETPMFK